MNRKEREIERDKILNVILDKIEELTLKVEALIPKEETSEKQSSKTAKKRA